MNTIIPFKKLVYKTVASIPKGRVATYGQIARLVGKPTGARAVGCFMRTNPDAPHTPCHRVVAWNGKLTGYSAGGGLVQKKMMLENEGVQVLRNTVDLKKYLWSGIV
jgi:O-6-methylguanine DNA methyltransferase